MVAISIICFSFADEYLDNARFSADTRPIYQQAYGERSPESTFSSEYISDKVFVHNTISSFVSFLISKHPYPYFNLNTITSAADILSVDSYMSIYAWRGYERIRTSGLVTYFKEIYNMVFRLIQVATYISTALYHLSYISKNYKSPSPLISITTSDNTNM